MMIYIPIWLDLLFSIFCFGSIQSVRHGIIYIPIWLDLLFFVEQLKKEYEGNLHSNMVRFIILYSLIIEL